MKVEIKNTQNDLIIIPETEFEQSFLTEMENNISSCWIKTGLSSSDIVALVIERKREINGK